MAATNDPLYLYLSKDILRIDSVNKIITKVDDPKTLFGSDFNSSSFNMSGKNQFYIYTKDENDIKYPVYITDEIGTGITQKLVNGDLTIIEVRCLKLNKKIGDAEYGRMFEKEFDPTT